LYFSSSTYQHKKNSGCFYKSTESYSRVHKITYEFGGPSEKKCQFSLIFYCKISIVCQKEKYNKGVDWLKDLLYHTQFTAERLKIITQKMANSIATLKRSGMKVVRTVFLDLVYPKGQ
jgi:Zn-dependent M16 (insulinase) family peptidase